jgi:putative transposase
MISQLSDTYPLRWMCQQLGVSVSGWYAQQSREPSARMQTEARLVVEIKAAQERTRQTYGRERLHHELTRQGVVISLHRLRQLRTKHGLACQPKRAFRVTTQSRHNLPVAANELNQQFSVTRPHQGWTTDLTYIRTDEGWLYLSALKDLFHGEIVGYAMAEQMTKALTLKALFCAVKAKRPRQGLIHHSDRGSQYCSTAYQQMLKQFGMTCSMSRKDNCYDNAPIESFWGTLKNELIYPHRFATREQAQQAITEYIEIFYNRQRIQASLGYLSPVAFLQQYDHPARAA